jgi:subfamily B ATP-binding cassette protein HlyB/CyaB
MVVVQLLRRPVRQYVAAELAARGAELGALTDAAAAIEQTKGLGVEQGLVERHANRVRARVAWSISGERLQLSASRALSLLGAVMHGTILWFGGSRVISGEMTLGVYVGFLAIWGLLEGSIVSLVNLAEAWARARGLLERCDDVLGVRAVERGRLVAPERLAGRIEVRDLGFRYSPGSPWIFRNVYFTIAPGEHVCVTGASGQGKSTLGLLLCGLLEPVEGSVLLDGSNVGKYDAASLARHVGVVLQNPVIASGTFVDNLTIREPAIAMDEVRAAIAQAQLEEVVRRLPGGYHARLEPLGANLSGGERQRLAIAQAILGRPSVLVLDEATSALDGDIEQRVVRSISDLGATTISIAHRDAVVERADRVLVVSGGNVTEAGPAARAKEPASPMKALLTEAACPSG